MPAHPLFLTPIRMSCGEGPPESAFNRSTAGGVRVKAALVARRTGFLAVGFDCAANRSGGWSMEADLELGITIGGSGCADGEGCI